ncbi:MAG: hypothetical protein RR617_08075 [Anaerovoracaceae bacterium]
MLKPHHISIIKEPFKYQNFLWMIPELLEEIEYEKILDSFSPYLLNTTGQEVRYGYQFIVRNREFYKKLNKTENISYLIAADEEYFKEVPLFFEDQWDSTLQLSEMNLLGWTINKFTEPAIFFGIYPIAETRGGYKINNLELINEWGLIANRKDAEEIAFKNTTIDPSSENWRALAVYVDTYSFAKLRARMQSEEA